jgi:ADP-dependent NAD(P)H-hydrate dehydratase / NAD(P)H-hydrate epimerase
MQKVLTAAEMREVDRLTTKRYGIPSIILMENAAHAVARVITEKLGGSVKGKSILVLCGKGNNGGDGAAIGRLLWQAGALVTIELFGAVSETKGDARTNFEILQSIVSKGAWEGSLWFREESTSIEDNGYFDWLGQSNFDFSDVVVDALFGTGLSRGLVGFHALQAENLSGWKREQDKPLFVSVDIPSGLSVDTGQIPGPSFEAHCTVTFSAPKIANVVGPAASCNGDLVIVNIGSPQNLIEEQSSNVFLAESIDTHEWLRKSKFSNDSYKNKRGHALLIAGSDNYSGAAVLCGNAAMRSGVGLVTIGTPRSSKDSIASRVLPEVMVRPLAETESGAVSEEAIEEIEKFSKNINAIAIGAGLSANDDSTRRFVKHFVENRTMPTILDADALTLLAPFERVGSPRGSSPHISKGSTQPIEPDDDQSSQMDPPVILTPHEGEFTRLLGKDDKGAIKDRVGAVRKFAQEKNVIIVLKGERVLIGHPDGRVVVNPTGNSGLGKAGNGDTLLGILTGFAAQAAAMDIDMFETIVAGVYVAGLAGDIAADKFGKHVMTASDTRECLAEAFRKCENDGL